MISLSSLPRGWFAIAAALLLLSAHGRASADDSVGALYLCQESTGTFQLLPSLKGETELPDSMFQQTGLRRLPDGDTHLSCRLGRYLLMAKISIDPPSDIMCEYSGAVWIYSITVDHVELFQVPGQTAEFDSQCPPSAGTLQMVEIAALARGVSIKKWFGSPTSEPRCESKTVTIESSPSKTP